MKCGNSEAVILASQIYRHGLRPAKGAKPVKMWTNHYCWQTALYYWLDDLEPATEEEVAMHLKADRDRRNARARELYHKKQNAKIAEEAERAAEEARLKAAYNAGELPLKTSWQWLSQEHRIPKNDAEAVPRRYKITPWYDDEPWENDPYYVTCYYYRKKDTLLVSDEEYCKLKSLYIKKYGGWDSIDLSSTSYDGRKWW